MSIPVLRYDLDITGINENNLVAGEVKTLSTAAQRVLAPTEGPFYAESFAIWDHATNVKLTYGAQYKFIEILQDPTAKYGKAIYGAVLITDSNVSSTVRCNYQCLGGYFKQNTDAIYALYETVINDNRSIDWATGILNKPLEYNPALHRHLLEDMYGFEPVVVALERIRNAILMNDVPVLEEIIANYNHLVNDVIVHENDKSNPHSVTAAQVGLGSVVNGGMATITEVNAGTAIDRYINPYTLKVVLDIIRSSITDLGNTLSVANTNLTNHINNNDAHGLIPVRNRLTAIEAMLPTFASLTQYNNLLESHNALSGTVSALSGAVSALNTALSDLNIIVSGISNSLTNHVNNKSNPHSVTAAQVSAYTIAQVDSLLLTANNAINTVTTNLNTHINNKSNPHEVTASQVGLGSVVNGGMASDTEVSAGTATNRYINPANLKTVLDVIRSSVTNHTNNKSNPHEVTAAQTGAYTTGQVDDLLDITNDKITTLESKVNTVIPYDLSGGVLGQFPGYAVIYIHEVVRSFTLPVNLVGSRCLSRNGVASISGTFTIKKNNVVVGTMIFGAGASVATFSLPSGKTFASGDYITVHTPAGDTALTDVAFTLAGTLNL